MTRAGDTGRRGEGVQPGVLESQRCDTRRPTSLSGLLPRGPVVSLLGGARS